MKTEENLAVKINSISDLAKYWKDSMPKKPGRRAENGEQREWDGLLAVLGEFSTFADDYAEVLAHAPIANQRFVMNDGAERLLRNFDILSRASEQRRGRITKNSPAYLLAQAEDQLTGYCSQWQLDTLSHAAYVTLKTPVAYFGKIYGISRALYAPEIPIVSIPLTEYNVSGRWFALAHEMGHHIYWNSLGDQERVKNLHDSMFKAMAALQGLPEGEIPEPWGFWMEETFADICGVLLEGPEYVLSTQDVAAEKIRKEKDFANNDGEHPSNYLRPWITFQVLCRVQSSNSNGESFLNSLEMRWKDFCEDSGELICNCGSKRKASLQELQGEVEPIVDVLLTHKLWPGNQSLQDLIHYLPRDMDLALIEPLPAFSGRDPQSIPPLTEDKIPLSIRESWNFLKQHIPVDPGKMQREKDKRDWDVLINLSIDDQHGHWFAGPHQNLQFHWWAPWAGFHSHDQGFT